MSRRQHTLSHTGRIPYPSAVVVVQARVSQHYLGEADDVGHQRIDHWYARAGDVVWPSIKWGRESSGSSAAEWWRWLRSVTCLLGVTHIYSWQAREVVAALGLWDQLADGTHQLSGVDAWGHGDKDKDGEDCGKGYCVLEGPPTIIGLRHGTDNRRIVWLDPANYGVKTLSRYLGEQYVADRPGMVADGELWREGMTPEHTVVAVCKWLDSYYLAVAGLDLGGPARTAASQAMQAFRHHYMTDRVVLHDNLDVCKMERAALYGGRCECRYIGELHAGNRPGELASADRPMAAARWDVGPIYYLDCNSMYPSLALNAPLPVELQAVCGPTNLDVLAAACKAVGVVAKVSVSTPRPLVPVRVDGEVHYPIGTFDTVLCGPEIQLCLAHHAIKRCRSIAVYRTAPIYTGLVQRLWTARRAYADQGDRGMADVIKSILNAAFGKWAQVRRRWQDVGGILPPHPYYQWWESDRDGNRIQYRSLAWHVQRAETDDTEGAETFPAITAYLQSLARVYLWGLTSAAGETNVYYYDTDSLICNQSGYDRLVESHMVDDTALGLLKVVGVHSHARIIGRQCYELDGRLTISGARGEVRRHGDAYCEQLVAPPIGYYLAHADPPGLERRVSRVRVGRTYRWGHVQPDGTVLPPEFRHG